MAVLGRNIPPLLLAMSLGELRDVRKDGAVPHGAATHRLLQRGCGHGGVKASSLSAVQDLSSCSRSGWFLPVPCIIQSPMAQVHSQGELPKRSPLVGKS